MISMFKTTPTIDFIRYTRTAFIFSGAMMLLTITSIVWHKGFNIGIDFDGGTLIQYRFTNDVIDDLPGLRSYIGKLGLGSIEIKSIGPVHDNVIQFCVKNRPGQPVPPGTLIGEALSQRYKSNPFELRIEEHVGPRVGAELRWKAILAIGVALLAIIIYMWIRFSLPFSMGAIAALLHDVMVTVGFFSITNREISVSFVAALLTIIGYSVNDTIVIFDRVREKFGGKLVHPGDMTPAINLSINETLSRTINTSAMVLFVLIGFSFFAGEVIRDFSLAMLVGCISGVYSTVYIASPVALWWERTWPTRLPPADPEAQTVAPVEPRGTVPPDDLWNDHR